MAAIGAEAGEATGVDGGCRTPVRAAGNVSAAAGAGVASGWRKERVRCGGTEVFAGVSGVTGVSIGAVTVVAVLLCWGWAGDDSPVPPSAGEAAWNRARPVGAGAVSAGASSPTGVGWPVEGFTGVEGLADPR